MSSEASRRRTRLAELARASARRVRAEVESWQEAEDVLAERFRQLLEGVLEAAESGSLCPIDHHLETLVALQAREGFRVADLLLAFREAEAALGDLVREEEGGHALGSERWRGIQAALRHAEGRFVSQFADYLEEKRSAGERRFAAVLEALPEMVVLADSEQRVRYVNGHSREILGLEPSEMVGKSFDEIMTPGVLERFADPDSFLAGARAMHAAPAEPHEDEVRLRDGRTLLRRSLPVREDGPLGRVAIYSDITTLLDFPGVFDSLLVPILLADEERRCVDANPSACALLARAREELLGARIDDFTLPEDLPRLPGLWQSFLESGRLEGELRLLRPDGAARNAAFTGNANVTPGQHLVVMVDTTEYRELEVQLHQAQRMEAIGRLAGGVAHDFNNFLTVMMGYAELALQRLEEGGPRSEIAEIKNAAERASALVAQLLAFGRRQVLEPRVLDLNALVSEVGRWLPRLLGEDIEFVMRLDPQLERVRADPGQLEQVITNLAVNARDAMPRGGRVTIETANAELDEGYARHHIAVRAGPYVLFAMSDAGIGMDEETQARIFEPFFTTKEAGKGTGLGLSTVYGIVKQSGGNIWVYSELGLGTTFKIYLPRVEDELDAAAEAGTRVASPPRGSETILLVEDDDTVRALAERVLEEHGYRVLVARDAADAQALCEKHRGRIDLLITDVVMPGAGGGEVADRVVQLRPEIRVLYMSGYTEDTVVHRGVLDPGVAFLGKPFTPGGLLAKVRAVLDAVRTAPGA